MKKHIVWMAVSAMLVLSGCGGIGSHGMEPTKKAEAVEIQQSEPDTEGAVENGQKNSDKRCRLLYRRNYYRANGELTGYREYTYDQSPFVYTYSQYIMTQSGEQQLPKLDKTSEGPEVTFDEEARTVTEQFPDGYHCSYFYDEQNRVSSKKSGDRTWWKYEYDDSGRMVGEVVLNRDGEPDATYGKDASTYEYDEAGNVVRIEYASGDHAEISYDEEGYPVKWAQYDANGKLDNWDAWEEFEYLEIPATEELPSFMDSLKEMITVDLIYWH